MKETLGERTKIIRFTGIAHIRRTFGLVALPRFSQAADLCDVFL